MSLNFQWFQNYTASKLNNRKNVRFHTKTDVQLWRLIILEPVEVQRHTVPRFKGLIKLCLEQPRSRAWQYFFHAPRPLEKSHSTTKNRDRPIGQKRADFESCLHQVWKRSASLYKQHVFWLGPFNWDKLRDFWPFFRESHLNLSEWILELKLELTLEKNTI